MAFIFICSMALTELEILKKELEDLNKQVAALGGSFFRDIDQAIINFGGGVEGAENAIRDLRTQINSLDTDVNYFYDSLKKVTKELLGQTNYNKDIAKAYTKLSSIANQLKYDQDGINELSQKELELLRKKIQYQQTDLTSHLENNQRAENDSLNTIKLLEKHITNLKNKKESVRNLTEDEVELLKKLEKQLVNERKIHKEIEQTNTEVINFLKDQENSLKVLSRVTTERLVKEKQINKTLGISGAMINGVVELLEKFGLKSSYFDDLKDDLRQAAKSGSSWKVMMEGIKGITEGLGKALRDPLTIMTAIIFALNKASTLVNDIQKNLGISYKNAYILNNQMGFFAATTDDTYITAERLNKSIIELNRNLGFIPVYGMESLETFTNLTERLGMTSEEAANLVTYSRLQNKNTESIVKNIGNVVTFMNKQKGTTISLRQIMSDVANASKAIAVSLGMNPELITRAATAARQLGINLSQVDKIAESLLNFESSIDNELQAELLTGKEINLERARALALSNDLEGLTKEIGKNQNVINTFAKGNRIAQDAIARSLGMSRDELANMIYQQEAMIIGAEGIRKKYGEQAYESLKAQSAQEKFANILNKIQSILVSLAGLFVPILDGIAWLLDHTWLWNTALGVIALTQIPSITKSIIGLGKTIQSVFSGEIITSWAGKLKDAVGKVKSTTSSVKETILEKVKNKTVENDKTKTSSISNLLKGIKINDVLKGAAAIAILSGALFVSAKAFQEFSEVSWDGVLKGITSLSALATIATLMGKVSGNIITGSIAIGLLGAALIPASYALQMFSDVNWDSIGKAGVVLAGLGVAGAIFGTFSALLIPGAIAIGALSVALIPFAFALRIVTPAIEAFGTVAKNVFDGLSNVINSTSKGISTIFSTLSNVDVSKLMLIGPALVGIGAGIASIGLGSTLNVIGNTIGSLFGNNSPIKMLIEISKLGEPLNLVAVSLKSVGEAFNQISISLNQIDVSKLEKISEFSSDMQKQSMFKIISSLVVTPIKAINKIMESDNEGMKEMNINLKPMIEAINEVKEAVDKLSQKSVIVNMDGRKVGSGNYNASYKLA